MTVGRKPKPTALKLVTGNPGKQAVHADTGKTFDETAAVNTEE